MATIDIYIKGQGFCNPSALQTDIARDLYSFYKDFVTRGGMYATDITRIYITSEIRAGAGSHTQGLAVDHVVKPAWCMPLMWEILHRYFNWNLYLATPYSTRKRQAPYTEADGWGLHIHADADYQKSRNTKRLERKIKDYSYALEKPFQTYGQINDVCDAYGIEMYYINASGDFKKMFDEQIETAKKLEPFESWMTNSFLYQAGKGFSDFGKLTLDVVEDAAIGLSKYALYALLIWGAYKLATDKAARRKISQKVKQIKGALSRK